MPGEICVLRVSVLPFLACHCACSELAIVGNAAGGGRKRGLLYLVCDAYLLFVHILSSMDVCSPPLSSNYTAHIQAQRRRVVEHITKEKAKGAVDARLATDLQALEDRLQDLIKWREVCGWVGECCMHDAGKEVVGRGQD